MAMILTNWSDFCRESDPDEYLRKSDCERTLPLVLQRLKGVPQRPDKHPEGDVWNHTLLVVKVARELSLRFNLTEDDQKLLLLASLTHDLGKITTTEVIPDGSIRSWKHEQPEVFLPLYNQLELDWSIPTVMKERLSALVQLHLPNSVTQGTEATAKEVKTYLRRLEEARLPFILARLLVAADQSGRLRGFSDPLEKWEPIIEGIAKASAAKSEVVSLVSGADLIELGFKPSPEFKKFLMKADELQKAGLDREQILDQLKQS
ncbi:MAG: HD domain-containing protein [Candidatus Riflebacteria bacterium]|nr:HD domain-containing protein [Candidatus Riflebacteria bacterium]